MNQQKNAFIDVLLEICCMSEPQFSVVMLFKKTQKHNLAMKRYYLPNE